MIALVLLGAEGRMGKAVGEAAAEAGDIRIRLGVDRGADVGAGAGKNPGSTRGFAVYAQDGSGERTEIRDGELGRVLEAGDVVVDFSSPDGTREAAIACAACSVPLVSGTTGLTSVQSQAIEAASRQVAVLRAANFSLGVLALRRVLIAALRSAPREWDVEIVERHHRNKADSPSGTALLLAREAARERGWTEAALRFGREGRIGARPNEEIGVHAVRGGSWVGDHEILLAGAGEWIELRHVAQDRGAFARGALSAARFVTGAGPGLYTLDHLLNPSP